MKIAVGFLLGVIFCVVLALDVATRSINQCDIPPVADTYKAGAL